MCDRGKYYNTDYFRGVLVTSLWPVHEKDHFFVLSRRGRRPKTGSNDGLTCAQFAAPLQVEEHHALQHGRAHSTSAHGSLERLWESTNN